MRQTILRLHRDLGLTILLSSHLLNEVEQLCTRIGVLRQGRKVFEGSLAEARQAQSWVRLGVDDFASATGDLRVAGLIAETRADGCVALTPGTETDAVVRRLVEQGRRVFEVTRVEQTLEDFYLSLMRR
jgi:ABC-2 type transport system ATP-binding protein